ncbi:MAG: hypothetical protein EOP61_18035 [Sphingomonadales bacterium]|nr:MAG: hypothetical protein EOP61_18035 [Sphingomonadales bacterium]
MKMILTGSLLALLAAVPLTALAAPKAPPAAATKHEESTTGAISVISATEVKLANGDTFKVMPGISTAAFKAGEKVKVQWSMKDGAKYAEHISAAKH